MRWIFFPTRLSANSKNRALAEIFKEKSIYKEFLFVNENSELLSKGKDSIISQIKSFHCERLHLQWMCEDDRYEQKIFQQRKLSKEDQDTDYESDSDLNHQQVSQHCSMFHMKEIPCFSLV